MNNKSNRSNVYKNFNNDKNNSMNNNQNSNNNKKKRNKKTNNNNNNNNNNINNYLLKRYYINLKILMNYNIIILVISLIIIQYSKIINIIN